MSSLKVKAIGFFLTLGLYAMGVSAQPVDDIIVGNETGCSIEIEIYCDAQGTLIGTGMQVAPFSRPKYPQNNPPCSGMPPCWAKISMFIYSTIICICSIQRLRIYRLRGK